MTYKEYKEDCIKHNKRKSFWFWFKHHKLWKFQNSTFVNHISFLWHWKNFFFCLKYPFWKSRNVYTGKFSGYSHTWYEDIPTGWQIAFGKQLSEDIKRAGKKTRKRLGKRIKWKDMLYWEQIKEKYGELRLYAYTSKEIDDVLYKYEILSIGYCISCGKPARYITDGWIEYLCENCYTRHLNLHKCSTKDIENFKKKNRITKKDIPVITRYDSDKPYIVDLKKEYNIDFNEIWGL